MAGVQSSARAKPRHHAQRRAGGEAPGTRTRRSGSNAGRSTMRAPTFAVLLALIAWPAAGQQRDDGPLQLLMVDEFHGDEVSARSGEEWLGLFPKGTGFTLRPTTISVSTVLDPILDEDTGPKTKKAVTTPGGVAPMFLVRGPGLTRRAAAP